MTSDPTVRVTGVLLHEGRLLVVKQRVDETRGWSLPGGKVERGETLGQALVREMSRTGSDLSLRFPKKKV